MVVEYLDVNSDTIVEIHSYVKYISNSRFRPSIEYLMSRHRSYSIDDFVQEVMELLLKSLKTKKFLEINQLKKYALNVIQYHYLTEKRKYFQTKQRGNVVEDSLDRIIDDNRELLDTIYDKTINYNNLQMKLFEQKRLCIVFNNQKISICKEKDLYTIIKNRKKKDLLSFIKDYSNQCDIQVISLCSFVKKQYEFENKNKLCGYYRSIGINMTKKKYDEISKLIEEYCKIYNIE